jgi:hypothetical protein
MDTRLYLTARSHMESSASLIVALMFPSIGIAWMNLLDIQQKHAVQNRCQKR